MVPGLVTVTISSSIDAKASAEAESVERVSH